MSARTHRRARSALLALLLSLAAASPAGAALDNAGYWAIADAQAERLDRFWEERSRAYRIGGGGADTNVNADLLLVHSLAARHGHEGPARNDRRARILALRLVSGPPFVDRGQAPAGTQRHAPGWVNSLDSAGGQQHLVFDAPIADGLTAAWRAREALELPQETVDLIVDRIHRVAAGRFYRWPSIRLNQVNWYALMYTSAATVAGDRHLLKRDMRLQLERFVEGIGARGSAAGNLGPDGRFHYLPHEPVGNRMNLDSAEYANVVLSVTRFLDSARAAGMRLTGSTRAALRGWATRSVAAYWTHAGYLNWDSGLGFDRWHQSKKLGLTQEALIGIATDRTLRLPARLQRWAKHVLDNGLLFYERLAQRAGGVPDGVFFGLRVVPQGPPAARLGASRIAANAARAVDAGLGSARSTEPPALYAFDSDVGRLAITTPHYNTAIVAVNQGAFPYGGVELARLFDGEQDVAGNIGGRPPAAFGLEVRDGAGRRVLATQAGRRGVVGRPGLRLARAGASLRTPRLGSMKTGPFRDLRVNGVVRGGTLTARTYHQFTPRYIDTTWVLSDRRGERGHRATVAFPSFGRGAHVEAELRDGRTVRVRRAPIALRRVKALHVHSEHSGYRVTFRSVPRGAAVSTRSVRRQPSAPTPGPTASIRIADGRVSRVKLGVRIRVDG